MSKSPNTKVNKRTVIALIFSGILLVVGVGVFADYWSAHPVEIVATYVGRDACIECHRDQYELYRHSDHDRSMDIATDETVLADFDDVSFAHDGMVSRMYRDGKRFMVYTEGETGEMEDFEVKYVFGVRPLQNYMVEFDRTADMPENEISRVQVLRLTWDTEKKEWFYLRPPDVADKLEPDDPLHWTGMAQRWQTMCAECHSTNLKTNFEPKTARYHTTFSEIDVSCEACHGPGSLHVELAKSKSLFWDRHHGYGLAQLKGEDSEPQLQTCAPCHSRRGALQFGFQPGDAYHDHYSLELLQSSTYFDDGQIKDEVYVYGSFMQSKMYHAGVRCSDCHDPHSLKLKHQGNETCTSCHQHPAGKYDVPSHHHHDPGTTGAMCVDCHMPERTYMEVDPRRDHSMRVPRPDLSVTIGTPNACSGCHVEDFKNELPTELHAELNEYADWLHLAEQGNEQVQKIIAKTDQWCDDACEKWYGKERQKPLHFSQPLAAFRKGDLRAVPTMLRLVSQPTELTPVIVRATLLAELGDANVAEAIPQAQAILENESEHPVVRAAAVGVFMNATPRMVIKHLMPIIDDPVRLVRNEAIRVLVASGAFQELSGTKRTQVELAARELHESMMVASDRGGAHLGWAILLEQQGRYDEAIESYETAIRVEPYSTGPRTNLAALLEGLAAQTTGPQAEQMLQRAKKLRDDELPMLGRDAKLAPENAFLQYRYGLALYLSGDMKQALAQLQKAVELDPETEIFATALRLLKEKMAESSAAN